MGGVLDFKTTQFIFKIKIIKKQHTVLLPDLLIFQLQQEILKFNDVCVSWSSPKTDLVADLLNPEN